MALDDLRAKYGQGPRPQGLQQQVDRGAFQAPVAAPAPQGGGGGGGLEDLRAKYGNARQPAWQTGGQYGSTQNGWNTPFYQKMVAQQQEAVDSGDPRALRNLSFSGNYTGVVTTDMRAKGEKRAYGDIYEDGKRIGNLWTGEGGFGKDEGRTILAELTLEQSRKSRAFSDEGKKPGTIVKALEEQRSTDQKRYDAYESQLDYEGTVSSLKKDWDSNVTGATSTAAGAAGGAALGAGIGAFFGGVGAAPGALIGGLIGGVGGWLNRDEITDQAARAAVQTGLSARDNPGLHTAGTWLRSWGQTGMSSISPLKNLYHGAVDAAAGKGGDGKSEYYEMEDRPWVMDAVDIGVTLGDSLAQFGGAAGRALFMASMATTTVGGVAQLGTGGLFDDRRGDFHAAEDFGQAAAAIGTVGIDALQLGMGGALSRVAGSRFAGMGRSSDDAASMGGRTFTLAEDGTVAGVRTNLQVLAPSEAVTWLGVRAKAAIRYNRSRVNGQATTSFDEALYQAARDIHGNVSLGQSTLLNTFGEGAEEAAQAILEPWAHGWNPDPMDVLQSALYGGAAGAGMTVGANLRRLQRAGGPEDQYQSQALLTVANQRRAALGRPAIDTDAWSKMTPAKREREGQITQADRDLADQITKIAREQEGRPAALSPMNSVIMEEFTRAEARELQNALPGEEKTHVVRQIGRTNVSPEEVQMSARTLLADLEGHWEGLRMAAAETQDADTKATLEAVIALVDGVDGQTGLRQAITQELQVAMDESLAPEQRAAAIEAVNQILEDLYHSTDRSHQRAASIIYSRPPNDGPGSFQIHLPQVDVRDTMEGSDGIRAFPWAALSGYKMDFDGDTNSNRVYLNMAASDIDFDNLRAGQNLTGTRDGDVVIMEHPSDVIVARAMQREVFLAGGTTTKSVREATESLNEWLRELLQGLPGQELVQQKIDVFTNSFQAGVSDLAGFMKWLNQNHGDSMLELGRTGTSVTRPGSQIYKHIDARTRNTLQNWQTQHSLRVPTGWQSEGDVMAIPETVQQGAVRRFGLDAATELHSAAVDSGKADLFRAIQALYYVDQRSGKITRDVEAPGLHTRYSDIYIAISSGVERSIGETRQRGDDLAKTAMNMLESFQDVFNTSLDSDSGGALASGSYAHLGRIATLPVPDIRPDGQGGYRDNGDTTIAQMILRIAADDVKRTALNNGADPETLRELDLAQNYSAGEAYLRLLGPLPAQTVLGEAASNFVGGETIDDIVAIYAGKNMRQRAVYRDIANSDIRAKGKSRMDLPHTEEMYRSGETTEYNTFLRAMFETVDGARSFDSNTGLLHGKDVDRDTDLITRLEGSRSVLRNELMSLSKAYNITIPDGAGQARTDALTRLLNLSPTYVTRTVAEFIPEGQRAAVFTPLDDGTFMVPSWFEEFLLSPNDQQAAMALFRATLLEQFQAQVESKQPFEAQDDLVRLMLQVQENDTLWRLFTDVLATSESITEFRSRINQEFESGPPILAFLRDSATHDKTLTQGGWDQSLSGTKLREALANFDGTASRYSQFVEGQLAADAKDQALNDIWLGLQRGDEDTQDLRGKYERAMQQARELPRAMTPYALLRGPQSMLQFQANSTDKGQSTAGTEHLGSYLLRGPSMTTGTGTSQMIDRVTASDSHSAAQNLPALAEGETLTMVDNYGRQFEWKVPTFDEFMELWNDPSNRPMLRSMVMPTVWDYNDEIGMLTQQQLGDGSLMDFLKRDTYGDILFGKDTQAKLQWVSMLDAKASEIPGGTFSVQLWISDIVQARASRFQRALTAADRQKLTIEATLQIADITRPLANMDVAELSQALDVAMTQAEQDSLLNEADPQIRAEQVKAIEALIGSRTMDENPNQELLDRITGSSTLDRLINQFVINWDGEETEVESKKQDLYDFVRNGSLWNASTEPVLADLMSSQIVHPDKDYPDLSLNEKENQELWDDASRAVIGILMQRAYQDLSTLNPAGPLSKESLAMVDREMKTIRERSLTDTGRYRDGTYSYLFDPIRSKSSPVMAAIQSLGRIMMPERSEGAVTGLTQEFGRALNDFADRRHYGPWTQAVATSSVFARGQILAGATDVAIGLEGSAFKKYAAIMEAARRTSEVPPVELARSYQIDGSLLQSLLDGITEGALPDTVSPLNPLDVLHSPLVQNLTDRGAPAEPLSLLNGRFASRVVVKYTVDGVEQETSLLRNGTTIDGSSPITAGTAYQGDIQSASPYQSISVDQLSRAVQSMEQRLSGARDVRIEVDFLHPQDQPSSPEYANNLYFEGVALPGAGDVHGSLLDAFYLSIEGLSPTGQRLALDAGKKGLSAFIQPDLPSSSSVRDITDVNDVYGTIQRKAEMFFRRSTGSEQLPAVLMPAVVKMMKMHHVVRVPEGDGFTLLSAEQAIEMQLAGNWDVEGAELIALSQSQVATLFNDPNGYGIPTDLPDGERHFARPASRWDGDINALAAENLPVLLSGEAGSFRTSSLNNVTQLRETSPLKVMTPQESELYSLRERKFESDRLEANTRRRESRSFHGPEAAARVNRITGAIMEDARALVQSPHLALQRAGIDITPLSERDVSESPAVAALLGDTFQQHIEKNPQATAFEYFHTAPGTRRDSLGVLVGPESLNYSDSSERIGDYPVRADIVKVSLSTFSETQLDEIEPVIRHFADRGTIIAPVVEAGVHREVRQEAELVLRELGYRPLVGSSNVWTPPEFQTKMPRTAAAYLAKRAETFQVSSRSFQTILHVADSPLAENAWYLNDNPSAARSEYVTRRSLAPTSAYPGFHIARTQDEVEVAYGALTALESNEEMQDFLFAQSTKGDLFGFSKLDWDALSKVRKGEAVDKARDDFRKAISRAVKNYSMSGKDDQIGLPKAGSMFGLGDIRVLVNNRGEIILDRNGFEPIPNETALYEQLEAEVPESWAGSGIATYASRGRDASSTVNGLIDRWEFVSGAGMEVLQRVPMSELATKLVLQGDGFKGLGTPMSQGPFSLPDFDVVEGMPIAAIINQADIDSKQAYTGVARNAQTLGAYLGFDAVQAFAKTLLDPSLTPQKWRAMTAEQQKPFRQKTRDLLYSAMRSAAEPLAGTAAQLRSLTDNGTALDLSLREFMDLSTVQAVTEFAPLSSILDAPADQREPEHLVTMAMITWMMSESAQDPSEIMSSAGFSRIDPNQEAFSTRMPEMFMSIFDRAGADSALHSWFQEQMNSRLRRSVGPEGESVGYFLDATNRIVVKTNNGERDIHGYLQFAPVTSLGADPALTTASADRRVRADLSRQETLVARASIGAETFVPGLKRFGEAVRRLRGQEKRVDTATTQGVETLLSGRTLQQRPRPAHVQRLLTRKQVAQLELQRAKMMETRVPLERTEEYDWDTQANKDYESRRAEILRMVGLGADYADWVDSWVRRENASPREKNGANARELGVVYPQDAQKALARIKANLVQGLLPTAGFPIAGLSAEEVRMLHSQAVARPGGWKLASKDQNLESYISAAIGEMVTSYVEPATRHAVAGFYNTFREIGGRHADAWVTMDLFEELNLVSPDTRDMAITMSRIDENLLSEPELANLVQATLQDHIEGTQPLETSTTGEQKLSSWRRKNNVPEMTPITYNEMMQGASRNFTSAGTSTPGFIRNVLLLRAGMGMANPILMAASLGEMGRSSAVESMANFVSGYGLGPVSKALSAIGGDAGFSKLTNDFRVQITQAKNSLGQLSSFRSMIAQDTTPDYQLQNAGRVERALSKTVGLLGRLQEPMYGARDSDFAHRYIIGALIALETEGSQTSLSPSELVDALTQNPQFLKDNYPVLHAGGTKAIEKVRMLRPSVATQAYRSFLNPLTRNPNKFVNIVSNLGINLPLMFAPFALNLGTSMLGLQGVSAAAAVLAARKDNNPSFAMKVRALMETGSMKNVGEQHDAKILENTLDGISIHQEFIAGGVTHTALMALGLLGYSLGLSGEDEEERRRRRAAEVAGVGHVFDPRKMERDFRNKDAIYFDNIPSWLDFIPGLAQLKEMTRVNEGGNGEATSMAQLHWSMKMFFSPMMGIERFLNNGDLDEIRWGFMDALGSMPLINSMTFDDATQISDKLAAEAAAAAEEGSADPERLQDAHKFLSNIVMTYERMLLENAFASEVYQAMDRYDRDNFSLPDVDEQGNILRSRVDGTPEPVQAYKTFINEEGIIDSGRATPPWKESVQRGYGEQRPVYAVLYNLFHGFAGGTNRSIWRYDQNVKTVKVDKDELSMDESQELILSMWNEATGREELTFQGSTGIIQGLRMGTLRPGDPALQNVFIPFEHRVAIDNMFTEQLIQDGLNLGLDPKSAEKRMNEVMRGSSNNPYAKGLWDVIWSKGDFEDAIPYNATTNYRQLNTTYVMGPDGFPYATGFQRQMIAPIQTQLNENDGALPTDHRSNSVDEQNNMNLGRRGLMATDESWSVPTSEDILKAMEDSTKKIIDEIKQSAFYGGGDGWRYGDGFGGRSYSRSGYSRGGGGGGRSYGGGGGGNGYFQRLGTPPRNNAQYTAENPYIRVDDPLLRRATIKRERFTSQRGRLKEWQ